MRNFILMPLGSNRIDRTGRAGQWLYTYVFGSLGGRISDVCSWTSIVSMTEHQHSEAHSDGEFGATFTTTSRHLQTLQRSENVSFLFDTRLHDTQGYVEFLTYMSNRSAYFQAALPLQVVSLIQLLTLAAATPTRLGVACDG